jgi:WD40 repeat protein
MRFTADGRTLVTTGADGKVIVWDLAHGAIRQVLSGHARGLTWGLGLSPDGRTAYSAGEDKRVFVWDLAGDRSLVRPFSATQPFLPDDGDTLPRGLAVSPDGRTLALGRSDGIVDFLDAGTLRPRGSVRALRGYVAALAFSPGGRLLAATGQRGRVTLWDARTLRPAGELSGQRTASQTLAFSPDGTLLAAAEIGTKRVATDSFEGGNVRVWDLRRRAPTGVRVPVSSAAIAFSPDGRHLAIAAGTLPTEVREARSGRLVARLRSPGEGRSVAFSPDGRLIVTGHFDGTTRLWSTETWELVGRPLDGHDRKRVLWAGFTRDGTMLVTAGEDGALELIDVATLSLIGAPLTIETGRYVAAALSPDGARVFAVSSNRAAVSWNITPEAWKRHACRVAGRELTPREWEDALPGRPYRAVCGAG